MSLRDDGAPGRSLFGVTFQNPVLLAAGTCGFGREVAEVVDLESLGGLVTKSVTLEPRWGNPAPRVTEFDGGMLNSVGLANPGVAAVRRDKLPWCRRLVKARVFVSLAGHTPDDYPRLIEALDDADGFLGYELNLSCPNDAARGGLPFALDAEVLPPILDACRSRTQRPLLAKLAPNDPDIAATAVRAAQAGVDGITLVNTLPGRILHEGSGRPVLGAGAGGVSGPALRPVGVQAVATVGEVVDVPLLGVGGIARPGHARQYLAAGASLVQMGTATFADPRAPERVARALTPRAA
jgi:dihydroorotate dehydrogenase (NAD+) catalytic subunit